MNGDLSFVDDGYLGDAFAEDLASEPEPESTIDSYEGEDFLGNALSVAGGLFNPVGAIAGTVANKLFQGRARRQPIRRTYSRGGGVASARLTTPRGSATLRLPAPVPTLDQFRRLETVVNQHATRLNSTQSDIGSLRARVASVVTDVAKSVAKARAEQKSQNTTNMMMSMLTQQSVQRDLEAHFHTGDNLAPSGSGATPAAIGARNNMALMLLPLMMGDGFGSDDNSMMTMMMMMLAFQRD